MYNLVNYFLLIITIIPLIGCQKLNKSTTQIDIKSYINKLELLQENPNNQTSIKITSDKAIIDPSKNDIEIFESTIKFLNKNGQDFKVESGNTYVNNLDNSILVSNNVNLSFLNKQNYYITTNSFEWDLNTSTIDIKNPVKINFENTLINATSGLYNIGSSLLRIDNSEFNRYIYNLKDKVEYQVEINSDFSKWYKKDNTLEFISNDKQVETTINFLLTE